METTSSSSPPAPPLVVPEVPSKPPAEPEPKPTPTFNEGQKVTLSGIITYIDSKWKHMKVLLDGSEKMAAPTEVTIFPQHVKEDK